MVLFLSSEIPVKERNNRWNYFPLSYCSSSSSNATLDPCINTVVPEEQTQKNTSANRTYMRIAGFHLEIRAPHEKFQRARRNRTILRNELVLHTSSSWLYSTEQSISSDHARLRQICWFMPAHTSDVWRILLHKIYGHGRVEQLRFKKSP